MFKISNEGILLLLYFTLTFISMNLLRFVTFLRSIFRVDLLLLNKLLLWRRKLNVLIWWRISNRKVRRSSHNDLRFWRTLRFLLWLLMFWGFLQVFLLFGSLWALSLVVHVLKNSIVYTWYLNLLVYSYIWNDVTLVWFSRFIVLSFLFLCV